MTKRGQSVRTGRFHTHLPDHRKPGADHVLDSSKDPEFGSDQSRYWKTKAGHPPGALDKSKLIQSLLLEIDRQVSQAERPHKPLDKDIDLEAVCHQAGLTYPQFEVMAMTSEGHSIAEISRFLKVTRGSVRDRLVAARLKLWDRFGVFQLDKKRA